MIEQLELFDATDLQPSQRRKWKTKKDFMNYNAFVEKFKPKKTTDDCYTPEKVYEAVLTFVEETFDIKGRPVVRPFCPGGDYLNYDYPGNCIVVDNPPFSIYAQIVRFYISRGIDFFLFGPHLTLFVGDADCTYVITSANIIYENGAIVNTSFVTNLVKDLRMWICPGLKERIEKTQKNNKPQLAKNTYPAEVLASSLTGKMLNSGAELKIRKEDCVYVPNLDCLRRRKKSLFGGGFLLSEKAVKEREQAEREAAEREAAERKAAARKSAGSVTVELSEREKNLIKSLSNKM